MKPWHRSHEDLRGALSVPHRAPGVDDVKRDLVARLSLLLLELERLERRPRRAEARPEGEGRREVGPSSAPAGGLMAFTSAR